jgi:tRNA(Ile)-lysidine synthase
MDSRALLHALVSLRPMHQKPIVIVHVHHGLSPYADDWASHAQQTAQAYGLPCIVQRVTVAKTASVEAAARQARYQAFNQVLTTGDVLILAHHQHDQAETVLLRLMRGSGVRGLAAMQEIGFVPYHNQAIPCWRPWLTISRDDIQLYAQQQQLSWVEDESNTNTDFNRNYLRHNVLPVLQQRWPQAIKQLAITSQRLRESDELLQEIAANDYLHVRDRGLTLNINKLTDLTVARRNNLLRYWLAQQALALPDYADLLRVWHEVCLAKADAEPVLAWQGVEVRRYRQQLFAMAPVVNVDWTLETLWLDKNQPLTLVTGECLLPEAVQQGINMTLWSTGQVSIRYRQGGEKIKPVGRQHHHDLKKLLQAQGVPAWQRQRIPLLYINQQLAAVLGYWIAEEFAA